jgi:prepilin-type N-terminal cleavage/methylation domain-containing protein
MKKQDISPKKITGGFTLIEVLLVMGITSILLVMGVMSMLGYLNSQNLETEARAMIALLGDAQSKSMSQDNNSRWGVYFKNETEGTRDSYVIFQADEALVASTTHVGVPGVALEQKTMRSNIELVSPAEATTTTILFSKVSGLPDASTTIVLQTTDNASSQKTIYISGNGKLDYQ